MNRKAFFFTIDTIMALGVLVVGFLLILSTHTYQPIESQTIFFSKDLLQVFSTTKVDQADNALIFQMRCTDCDCGTNCGLITNLDNTLLEQLGEFIYRSENGCSEPCLNAAKEIATSVSQSLINPQFSYEFVIKDTTGNPCNYCTKENADYAYYMLNKTKITKDKTNLLIVSKRLIYGIADNEHMFGPYVAEVRVWQ